MEKSRITVQAKISKVFLQKAIEKELKRVLGSNGLTLNLPQGELLIESVENIQYQVSSRGIQVAADVEVEYNKEAGINVAGQAVINVVINMDYEIASNFTLQTKTKLKDHSWVEKPTVKVGKLKIPSQAVLNLLINGFDEKFGRQIDEIIAQKLDLQQLVTAELAKAENPLPNPIDKNIHLFISPAELLFNIQEREVDYKLSVYTNFDAKAKWEVLPIQKIFSALPAIQEYNGEASLSKLNVPVKVMFSCLAASLKKQFSSVELVGRKLSIQDIKIKYKDRLYIEAEISGDISGTLKADAIPRLNREDQVLYFDNLQYDLETSNFLVKAATFLFKGEIDKRIDQFSSIPLKPILKPLIKDLNRKLREFKMDGIDFEIHLDTLEVTDLILVEDCFMTQVELKADGQMA